MGYSPWGCKELDTTNTSIFFNYIFRPNFKNPTWTRFIELQGGMYIFKVFFIVKKVLKYTSKIITWGIFHVLTLCQTSTFISSYLILFYLSYHCSCPPRLFWSKFHISHHFIGKYFIICLWKKMDSLKKKKQPEKEWSNDHTWRNWQYGFSRVAAGTWGIFSSYDGDAHSKWEFV